MKTLVRHIIIQQISWIWKQQNIWIFTILFQYILYILSRNNDLADNKCCIRHFRMQVTNILDILS